MAGDELERRFGPDVARFVATVSEPSTDGSYRDRKARLREAISQAQRDAALIFGADKVAKSRELRMRLAQSRDPGAFPAEKTEYYWASLPVLERALGPHPLVR